MKAGKTPKVRRRLFYRIGQWVAGRAVRRGPETIRRWGERIGRWHHAMARGERRRLARDIAIALDLPVDLAARHLARAWRINDRAVFELLAMADPRCRVEALAETLTIDGTEALPPNGSGAILLGMHMGNGVLMAGKLSRQHRPVHVVAKAPRRLAPGTLEASIRHAGAIPLMIDRANPGRAFREMHGVLRSGGLLFVLLDQGTKEGGRTVTFLGKPVQMPEGVPRLAARLGVPVLPVLLEEADAGWRFRIHPPLAGHNADELLIAACTAMENHVRAHPDLWSWHQRRWRRYAFTQPPSTPEGVAPCP
ncbi:MAG: hypothetical protein Kow0020_09720 [Wenzhouxiangellaceae bacterium]